MIVMRRNSQEGICLVFLLSLRFNLPVQISFYAEVIIGIIEEAPFTVGCHYSWTVDSQFTTLDLFLNEIRLSGLHSSHEEAC